jgi:hypothetical protein
MQVKIGPHINWIGPYQIADLLQKVGVSEDVCFKIGERISNTWINTLCEWIHSKKKRKVVVRIDGYDTWNMDSTLATIILPMLKQLKATKHGAPLVDDNDVPEGLNLRSTEAPPKENEWDTDENHFKRWDWVLDEMVWAFEQLQPDCEWEEQFHSGVSDIQWIDSPDHPECKQMVKGPNDTRQFDADGHKKHSDRIDGGLRLFGVYFRGLWD